ncbi:MAG: DNA-3-methyladenine glycosylase I [Ectothiorhodospiraceae bacterium]|nr:DNA-3-methyladenine glycosylase I [Ectothiorhodospiraceae bacterium]
MAHKTRCAWVPEDNDLYQAYHDEEWAVPEYDDLHLFEMLLLEGAQAGLSWITILKKRDTYREAFDNFDPAKIARYDSRRLASLLKNEGIVRNRLKVNAAVKNARAYLVLQKALNAEGSSFSEYLWGFVGGEPVVNCWKSLSEIPSKTEVSDAMAKSLKKHGFSFVGSTICYAFMQAVGMVNDHEVGCFCYPH